MKAFATIAVILAALQCGFAAPPAKPRLRLNIRVPSKVEVDSPNVGGVGQGYIEVKAEVQNLGDEPVMHDPATFKFQIAASGGLNLPPENIQVVKDKEAKPAVLKKFVSVEGTKTINVTRGLEVGRAYVVTCEVDGAKARARFTTIERGSAPVRKPRKALR